MTTRARAVQGLGPRQNRQKELINEPANQENRRRRHLHHPNVPRLPPTQVVASTGRRRVRGTRPKRSPDYGVRIAPITVIGDWFTYGTFADQKPRIEDSLKLHEEART